MRLSGSKLGLAILCQYPYRTDIPEPTHDAHDGLSAADIGTQAHNVASAKINGTTIPQVGPEAARFQIERHVDELLQTWPTAEAELAFAWDALRNENPCRYLGKDIGRAYKDLSDTEIPLSLDVVAVEGDRALVLDWKTGSRDHVDPIETNLQLALGALCVYNRYPVNEVIVRLAFLTDDGHMQCDSHTYDALSLIDVEQRIKKIVQAIPTSMPRPGQHCVSKYCPIRSSCPATIAAETALVRATYTKFPMAINSSKDITGPDHAAYLLHRIQAVEEAAEIVKTCLKTYAATNGPIPVGADKAWGKWKTSSEYISATDPIDIYNVLTEYVDLEEFANIVSTTCPKGELEKMIKGRHGLQAWRRAWSKLKDAGLIKSKVMERHETRKVTNNG